MAGPPFAPYSLFAVVLALLVRAATLSLLSCVVRPLAKAAIGLETGCLTKEWVPLPSF